MQELLGEVREAGWDGAFTTDPEGLDKGDVQVIINHPNLTCLSPESR